MPNQIGLFEAKAKLSELVRNASQGESYLITVRGQVMAEIIPHRAARSEAVREAVENLRNFPRDPAVPHETIREWIEEGRE